MLIYDFFSLKKNIIIVKTNQILKERYSKYENTEKLLDFLKRIKNWLSFKKNSDKNEICHKHKFYYEFKELMLKKIDEEKN